MPRLLVVTKIWPTAEAPSAGIFVRNRVAGVPGITLLVGRDRGRWALDLLDFVWRGLTVRGRFDGVEAHVLYPAGLVGLLAARLRRIPLLAYAHGTDVREVSIRGRGYRLFVRLVARRADLVVTNSADTARYVRQLGAEARIIRPGIDADLFHASPRPPPGARRVLYLGGTNPRKGYEVARRLADTLVGPGIREAAPPEVARLLAEHDVLLVPSVTEPFGLVAAEAIASGRWVVANRVGGLPDIVRDGVNGTLVDDGDYAAALATVPDYDPEAISPSVEHLSARRWQAEMDAAWEELLATRRRRRPA